jgi:hypothetical protein
MEINIASKIEYKATVDTASTLDCQKHISTIEKIIRTIDIA